MRSLFSSSVHTVFVSDLATTSSDVRRVMQDRVVGVIVGTLKSALVDFVDQVIRGWVGPRLGLEFGKLS